MKSFSVVLMTLLVQGTLVLGLSYFGAFVSVGDSVAVFRLQIASVIFIGGLVLLIARGGLPAFLFVLISGISAGQILAGFFVTSDVEPGSITLYQKNLLYKNLSRWDLTRDILAVDPDIVTFQEISDHDHLYMQSLFQAYDNKLDCSSDNQGATGILTRFPIVPGSETCLPKERLSALQVNKKDGSKFWIVSLHLGWPYPAGQVVQADAIKNWLGTIEGPVVLAGDFNMVPWGSTVKGVVQASKTRRLGKYHSTFPAGGMFFPLPIDHVLLPEGATGQTEIRPLAGSDHFGVVARFDF